MLENLVVGLVALAIAAGMLFVAWPNRDGDSPRFLRSYGAPMFYVPAVLVFIALGIAELITWALGAK